MLRRQQNLVYVIEVDGGAVEVECGFAHRCRCALGKRTQPAGEVQLGLSLGKGQQGEKHGGGSVHRGEM